MVDSIVREISDNELPGIVFALSFEKRVVVLVTDEHGCHPCRTIKPAYLTLAAEFDKAQFYVLPSKFGAITIERYQVLQVPTILVFGDGVLTHRLAGDPGLKRLTEIFTTWFRSPGDEEEVCDQLPLDAAEKGGEEVG